MIACLNCAWFWPTSSTRTRMFPVEQLRESKMNCYLSHSVEGNRVLIPELLTYLKLISSILASTNNPSPLLLAVRLRDFNSLNSNMALDPVTDVQLTWWARMQNTSNQRVTWSVFIHRLQKLKHERVTTFKSTVDAYIFRKAHKDYCSEFEVLMKLVNFAKFAMHAKEAPADDDNLVSEIRKKMSPHCGILLDLAMSNRAKLGEDD